MIATLAGVPCPAWVRREFDAHERRRRLVLDIWALSDKSTAFAALWLARAAAIGHPTMTVENGLRFFRGNLMR